MTHFIYQTSFDAVQKLVLFELLPVLLTKQKGHYDVLRYTVYDNECYDVVLSIAKALGQEYAYRGQIEELRGRPRGVCFTRL